MPYKRVTGNLQVRMPRLPGGACVKWTICEDHGVRFRSWKLDRPLLLNRYATKSCCCCGGCGDVGNAAALSKLVRRTSWRSTVAQLEGDTLAVILSGNQCNMGCLG
jgi:hypothetical protein